jgi:hypothetical protein
VFEGLRETLIVHTYNPSYLGNKGRRIQIPGCPGKKYETLLKKNQKPKRQGSWFMW